MEKQWIEDLRKRFDDRKAPVPEGLWDDIESAMAEAGADAVDSSTGKRRARIVPLWGRWSAAAAVCAALVVGLVKYSQPAPTELASVGSAPHKSADVSAAKSSDNVAYESASTDEAGDAVQPALSRLKAGVAAVVERAKERAAVDSVRVETADENLVAEAGVAADKENKAAETVKKEVSVVRHQPSGRRQSPYRADNDDLLAVSSHKRRVFTNSQGKLPSEANHLLLSTHILKHLINEGIGLRQLCDIAMAFNALHSVTNKNELECICRKWHIHRWNRLLYALLIKYLGVPADLLPFSTSLCPDKLMQEIWESGNFGHGDERYGERPTGKWANKRYTLKRIFHKMHLSLGYAFDETFWWLAGLALLRFKEMIKKK